MFTVFSIRLNVVRVQAAVRCCLARNDIEKWFAAKVLQACVSRLLAEMGYAGMHALEQKMRAHEAARVLQACIRAHFGLCEALRMRRGLRLCEFVRRLFDRRPFTLSACGMSLRAWTRRTLARVKMCEMVVQAIKLQCVLRRGVLQRKMIAHLASAMQVCGVETLQATCRRLMVHRVAWAWHRAATRIQAVYKGHEGRYVPLRQHLTKCNACMCLLCARGVPVVMSTDVLDRSAKKVLWTYVEIVSAGMWPRVSV